MLLMPPRFPELNLGEHSELAGLVNTECLRRPPDGRMKKSRNPRKPPEVSLSPPAWNASVQKSLQTRLLTGAAHLAVLARLDTGTVTECA